MATLLYALGRWASRARIFVLIAWIAILALLGGGAALFSQGANGAISIPGTESQAALDMLSRTFPQVSGTSASVIVVAPTGSRADKEPYRQAIIDTAAELAALDVAVGVTSPFAELAPNKLSENGRAALIRVQLDVAPGDIPEHVTSTFSSLTDKLRATLPQGSEVSYGGDAFATEIPSFSPTEALGVVIAFIVLLLTLGSLLAAGMPLLIAVLGVGISVAGIFFATAFIELTSTTPMLALMLGLAVGIDYTLFIVIRHQEQLRAGVPLEESIARANATSGSAVIFAGITVIIALLALGVAGIPFLTALGVAAAVAVAVAVLIAITLTPAVLAMAGTRILPKRARRRLEVDSAAGGAHELSGAHDVQPQKPPFSERFFAAWVRIVTAKPLVTALVVLLALGAASIPAANLRLALPGAEALAAEHPARITNELIGEHFGEGYNGPLLLTGTIVTSTDPLGLMEQLAQEVRELPGVAEVPLSTPNAGADTGIMHIIPEEGPKAQSTADLVAELRAHQQEWLAEYGVELYVTGFTAAAIDISQLLFEALLPFALLVVGLSLLLLAMVFRSVWVPIKATLGYLLSVGAAFGAVVAVFQWGWFAELFHVHHIGPVMSFLPIILMGVLFGLAMDYEVFLVSRIREEVVHGAEARAAIRRGFIGSGRVVAAAAIIMFAVFVAFVPEGDASIKIIAFGLAVGVFVDAFVVRMTLVPAVLHLLGDRAWHMPRWLDRLLPAFDVEGEGLARELAYARWPEDAPNARISSAGLVLPGGAMVPELRVPAHAALLLDPADSRGGSFAVPLAYALSGRGSVTAGTLKVAGLLLPERSATLRRRSAWATPATLREALAEHPEVVVCDLRGEVSASALADCAGQLSAYAADGTASAAAAETAAAVRAPAPILVMLGSRERALAALPQRTILIEPQKGAAASAPERGLSDTAAPQSHNHAIEGARI